MLQQRSNRRGALTWVAVLLLCLLLGGAMTLHARAGAVRGACAGSEVEAQALLVGESALDELDLRVQRAALADPAGFALALDGTLAAPPARANALAEQRAHAGTGFRVAAQSGRLELDGDPATERRGALSLSVTVEARAGRRTFARTVTRRRGVRIARLGLAAPYTGSVLTLDDGVPVAQALEDLAELGRTRLAELQGAYGEVLADAARLGAPRAARHLARLRDLSDALTERRALPLRGPLMLAVAPGAVPVADAHALAPLDAWDARAGALEAAYRALVDDTDGDPEHAVDAAMERVLDAAARLVDAVRVTDRVWVPARRVPATDDWSARAWWSDTSPAAVAPLLGGPERSGVFAGVDARDLDRAAVWGDARGGRLVLAVRGGVRLHDLEAPAGAALTVVADGPVTLAGRVDADVVARAGLTVEPGADVHGHLVLAGGPLQLGERARLAAKLSPGQGLRVAFDPCPAN